jgi:hypothetical protein
MNLLDLFSKDIQKWWKKYGIYITLFSLVFIFILLIWYTSNDEVMQENISFFDSENPFQPSGEIKSKSKKRKIVTESKGEIECKRVVSSVLNKPFYKIRPDFLQNDETGHNLEIDIFNDELKLGIEYNGRQHYEYLPYFHKDYNTFLKQKYRDELKMKRCGQNGVQLIVVPYTVKHKDIEGFLLRELKRLQYI